MAIENSWIVSIDILELLAKDIVHDYSNMKFIQITTNNSILKWLWYYLFSQYINNFFLM